MKNKVWKFLRDSNLALQDKNILKIKNLRQIIEYFFQCQFFNSAYFLI